MAKPVPHAFTRPIGSRDRALILARQNIIRRALRAEMRSPGYASLVRVNLLGEVMHARNIMRAKGAITREGRSLLIRKGWRAQAWEMRYPGSVLIELMTPGNWSSAKRAMLTTYHTTTVSDSGWTPAPVDALVIPTLADVSELDALSWLGFAGGVHSHGEHADPYWEPITAQERINDVALQFDDELDTDWEDEDAARWGNTLLWWRTMIGFAWTLAESDAPSITVETFSDATPPVMTVETLTGGDAVEWPLANLEERIALGVRHFFDNHDEAAWTARLAERRPTLVDRNRTGDRVQTALSANDWLLLSTTHYTAALSWT